MWENLLGTWIIKTKGRKVKKNKITQIKSFGKHAHVKSIIIELPCALKKSVMNKGDTKRIPQL